MVLQDIRFIINLLRIQLWLAFDEEGFGGFLVDCLALFCIDSHVIANKESFLSSF